MALPTNNWYRIHDFLNGFGYANGERRLFYWQAEKFLGIILQKDSDFEELYARIQPLYETWLEERRKNEVPFNPKRISIPRVNRVYPKL